MDWTIRKAAKEDIPALFELLKSQAVNLGKVDCFINTPEKMESEWDTFEALLVLNKEGCVIGEAVYVFSYSTYRGKMLYLNDLFVKEAYRRQKVGTNLMQALKKIALENDCDNIHWSVRDYNKDAIDFYKNQGVIFDTDGLECYLKLTKYKK